MKILQKKKSAVLDFVFSDDDKNNTDNLATFFSSGKTVAELKILKTLINSVLDSIIIIDARGNILFLNQPSLKLVSFPENQKWQGYNIFQFIHPDDRKKAFQHIRKVRMNRGNFLAEYRIYTTNHQLKWVEVSGNQILFHDKRAIVIIIRDISDKKRVEEEVSTGRANLKALIENTTDSIWSVDENICVTTLNSTFQRLFQQIFQVKLKIGSNLIHLLPPELRPKWQERFQRALQGENFTVEDQFKFDNISTDIEVTFNPIYYENRIKGVAVFARDITARKQIERALRESENRFRSIVENVPTIAVHGYDSNRRVIFWNRACEKLYGYTQQESLGKKMEDLILPDKIKKEIIAEIKRLGNRDHQLPMQELTLQRKDGSLVHVLSSNVLLQNNEGEKTFYFLDIDLTDLKTAQEALRESELKYRMLTETARDIIVLIDLQGHIVYLNQAGYEATGLSKEKLSQTNVLDLIPADQVAQVAPRLQRRREGENQVFLYETEFINKNGGRTPVEISSALINKNGSPSLVLLVVRDITERRRVQGEMKMLAHAVKSITESVSVTDMEDRIIFVNEAFLNTYGYQRDEIIGQPISVVRSKHNPPEVINSILPETLKGGWQGEILNRRKNGEEFSIFLSTSIIRDEENQPVALVGVARDITDWKKMAEQLRQAQKMEAIGRLAGGIAHDFNNLLTIIRGYSELLLSRLSYDNFLRSYIAQINKAGERAESLTRQLLAFSRRQILQPKILNLNHQLRDMENMIRRLIGEDLEFTMELDPDLGNIHADPGQIQQLVLNLVVNSRDAILSNGRISIETQNVTLDGEYLKRHKIVQAGHYVMLAVSDNGQGIKKEHLDLIFEPFFTTKEEGKGTGLGLSTVYGIVKQSNGYIWVYSEYGIGTTFKVYFPREKGEISAEVQSPTLQKRFIGNETILVVEDEEDLRRLMCETLEKYNYKVLEAPHGLAGLEVGEQCQTPIHLVVTDVVMPRMGGREFVEQLLKIHPETKVLYISGYTNNAIVHKGILDASTNFLQKPFSISELLEVIRQLLDQPPSSKN